MTAKPLQHGWPPAEAMVVDLTHGATAGERRLTVTDKLNRLPPFHPAVLRMLNITIHSDSAETEYEEAFKSDPSLTADLLRMANSAAYGGRSTVQTIRRAIRFLGLEPVRALATTIALRAHLHRGVESGYLLTVWAHSIATAVAAEALGALHGLPGLYTIGLTHDLGRLGLFLSVGDPYGVQMLNEFEDVQHACESENALCGMTHCDAGALIAREWGFPESMTACMAEHHNLPPSSDVSRRLVSTACVMAAALGFPEVPLRELPPFPEMDRMEYSGALEPETLWNEITLRIANLEG